MKQFVKLAGLIFLVMIILAGCSKEEKGPVGWLDSLEEGKTLAQKENKNILLVFSSDDDGITPRLNKELFTLPEFINSLSADYVLVNLDFSQSVFDAAQPNENTSPEEKEKIDVLSAKLDAGMKNSRIYGVKDFPTCFVLSKEGYVIREVSFFAQNENFVPDENQTNYDEAAVRPYTMTEAKVAVSSVKPAVDYVNNLCRIIEGSGAFQDKISAIEELFNYTGVINPAYCYALTDLSRKVIALDKNNETGHVGKHMLILAKYQAEELLTDQKLLSASEAYEKVAENPILKPEEKQAALFNAGFILAAGGSTNYEKIIQYYDAAIAADPENEGVPEIESLKTLTENQRDFSDQAGNGGLSGENPSDQENSVQNAESVN